MTGKVTLMMEPFLEADYQVELNGKMDIGGGYQGGFHGISSGLQAWTRASNVTKPTRVREFLELKETTNQRSVVCSRCISAYLVHPYKWFSLCDVEGRAKGCIDNRLRLE